MANVLYISYTGLLDPLGQSQVLQYVLLLAKKHKLTVLSFEKSPNLKDTARVAALHEKCSSVGIDWHYLEWHNRPGMIATAYDVVAGIRIANRLAKRHGVSVLHCRSYIGSLIGLAVKKLTGARLIFDMRGFWPDERVDGGIWSRNSLVFRLVKKLERVLFLNADHIVSLTRAGVRIFRGFDYLVGRELQVSVIPTCTNLDVFRPLEGTRQGFCLGYVGSVGSWYLFGDVARVVRRLFELRPDARFLVINKGGHDLIRQELADAGIDMSRVDIREVGYAQVPCEIAEMDAAIFFVKPALSKSASCPTRLGEFLACGKPVLVNEGVGDVAEILQGRGVGIALPVKSEDEVDLEGGDVAIANLIDLAGNENIAQMSRAVAVEEFSLERGAAEYDRIYARLSGTGAIL